MGVALNKNQVQLAAAQPGQARALLDLLNNELQPGTALTQFQEQGQEQSAHGSGEGPHAHHSGGGVVVEPGEFAARGSDLALDPLGGVGQDMTGLGEHRPGGSAVQHASAGLLLQEADLLRDRRGADVQGVGGRYNSPAAVDGQEHGKPMRRKIHEVKLHALCR